MMAAGWQWYRMQPEVDCMGAESTDYKKASFPRGWAAFCAVARDFQNESSERGAPRMHRFSEQGGRDADKRF